MYFVFRSWEFGYRLIIQCDLQYARWMINTGKAVGGIWKSPTNTVYL